MKDKPARDAVQDAGFLFCEFCGDELFFAVLTLLVPAPRSGRRYCWNLSLNGPGVKEFSVLVNGLVAGNRRKRFRIQEQVLIIYSGLRRLDERRRPAFKSKT